MKKNKFLMVRVSEDTNKQIRRVALSLGLTDKSETVRQLIFKEYKRLERQDERKIKMYK